MENKKAVAKNLKEKYPLSTGEILRTKDEWWMADDAMVTSQPLKGKRILLEAETGFSGFVGEHIAIYSYAVIDWNTGKLIIIPIKSVEDYKREVYPYQFKKARIASWSAMKEHSLFGWSEDPRPYVE